MKYLALDLVDRILGVFDVRGESGGDTAGIGEDSCGVVRDAHDGDASKSDGVHYSVRGPQTEPPVYENKHRR